MLHIAVIFVKTEKLLSTMQFDPETSQAAD